MIGPPVVSPATSACSDLHVRFTSLGNSTRKPMSSNLPVYLKAAQCQARDRKQLVTAYVTLRKRCLLVLVQAPDVCTTVQCTLSMVARVARVHSAWLYSNPVRQRSRTGGGCTRQLMDQIGTQANSWCRSHLVQLNPVCS